MGPGPTHTHDKGRGRTQGVTNEQGHGQRSAPRSCSCWLERKVSLHLCKLRLWKYSCDLCGPFSLPDVAVNPTVKSERRLCQKLIRCYRPSDM